MSPIFHLNTDHMDVPADWRKRQFDRLNGVIVDLERAMKELVDALVTGNLSWSGFKQWMVKLILVGLVDAPPIIS